MTYKELIMFVLRNNLENEPVFNGNKLAGFLTIEEAAVKYNVGIITINVLMQEGHLDYVKIGDQYFIPDDVDTCLS